MSSFSKLVLIGVAALGALASVGAEARSDVAAHRERVLAAHRQVVSATPVALHRHHLHHRRHHVQRPVRHR